MINRRHFLIGGTLAASLMSNGARATEYVPFDAEAFRAAQSSDKSILVHVTAPWCGTCRKQKSILTNLIEEPGFKDFVVLEIDYDTQLDLRQKFKVPVRSTMIVFKGARETGRMVGETRAAVIESLLRKAL